jgi:hypothetical protein
MTRRRKLPPVSPETKPRDLDDQNGWFPKAAGLWRVQGGALALLSWKGHQIYKYYKVNVATPPLVRG